MKRLTLRHCLSLLATFVPLIFGASVAQTVPSIGVPSGTKVQMALLRPVWVAKVKVGDPIYAQTVFPVAVAQGGMAIPAGTYVMGKIDAVTVPTRKAQRGNLKIEFHKLVLANGYTIELAKGSTPPISDVAVQATTANDLLLDNGSQLEMGLPAALTLDAAKVAQAVPLSRAPKPGSFAGATLCRTIPGTPGSPGTPDTVIPGSPGTPPVSIVNADGTSTEVSPGTPATPPTVIPGTAADPGTDPIYCPAPPIVTSSTPELPAGAAISAQTSQLNR